jgi:hypothetical protein
MIPQSALPDCPGTPRTSVSALLNSGYRTNKALKKMESTSENGRRYPEKYPTIPPLGDLYTPRPAVYDDRRGVRNLKGGNRTRQTCGIFVCAPCLDSVYGLEGWEIPKYPPPFLCGSEPPSRPSPGIASTSEIQRSASHGQ